jgi:hypothetical protein
MSSNSNSLREQIFKLLDNEGRPDPLLSPKLICQTLKLPYKQYHNYVSKTKWEWKYYRPSERGSKCSFLHCFKAKVRLEVGLSGGLRLLALRGGFGWVQSKARNRFLVWRGGLGRVVWFETGTVTLHVRAPGNLGRAKQLFCDAFGNTGLIVDLRVLTEYSEKVWQKGLHAPYKTSQRLPKLTISDFAGSHGITVKVGDRSHPNAVEVIAEFPLHVERLIAQVESFKAENLELKNVLGKLVSSLNGALEKPEIPKVVSPLDRVGDYSR